MPSTGTCTERYTEAESTKNQADIMKKNKSWKFYLMLAIIGFLLAFLMQEIESNYERASDKLIAAEFTNEKIGQHKIFEVRGFKTDGFTINNEKYLLNQDTFPNILVENILDYSVTKTANSNKIKLTNNQNTITFNLWTYDKFRYWKNRILFSLFGSLIFMLGGFLKSKFG